MVARFLVNPLIVFWCILPVCKERFLQILLLTHLKLLRNPLTLFWRAEILSGQSCLLQTLINKNGHQGSSPGGHSFVY
jgi:hypothetical protein